MAAPGAGGAEVTDSGPAKRLRSKGPSGGMDGPPEADMTAGEPAQWAAHAAVPATLPAPEWAAVIEQVKSAIVAIRITGVRPFEDSPAGVWHGTGFVVSLRNPKRALILTNRHIVTTGPIRAFATFDEHEEMPVFPVYRDPVHDFGLLQFDSTQLRFTPPCQIPLSPPGLRVGVEVLVIGNDNAEKIQILPATIARIDRNSPEYDDTNYQDENTFYAGAGSNTSGGSSGSPVIDRSGACIALNAGGANEAASAYYLPLDRVVYALEWILSHEGEAPLPPRGTLLSKFLFQPFDLVRRLGFSEEQERDILASSPGSEDTGGRPKGMLVVESFLPGTEAEQKLKPGDVLLEVAGKRCLVFAELESHLDASVGTTVPIVISRAGSRLELTLGVANLHELIPHDFVECGGGVFHQLSYHTCKRFHLPIEDRGVFVVQSGFGFGLELPYHAVITGVGGEATSTLRDFEAALSGVPDKETFEVSWFNPTTNERRSKKSSVRMESNLWALSSWRFEPGYPNTWTRGLVRALPAEGAPASAGAQASASGGAGSEGSPETEDPEDPLSYPPSRDPTIARLQSMLCTVTSRMAHEFATDFIQSEDERNSTLIRRFGVGLVVDVQRGLVLTDRYTVPQPLSHVELTFAQIVTTDAVCLFVHPQHNLVLLRYDVAAVKSLPIRAVDIQWAEALGLQALPAQVPSGTQADGADDAEEGERQREEAAAATEHELSIGEVLCFVSLHGDHRLSAKQVTVGSVYLKAWAFCEPPAYRERNLEICNLNDTLQGLGGVLVEPGSTGRVRAWFAQFPAGKRHYVAGVPIPVLIGLLRPLGIAGGGSAGPAAALAPPAPHAAEVPCLDCEFEELSLAKARRYNGMSLESARELSLSCSDGRRQVLMVSRVTGGGAFDGRLSEGDVVLKVGGRPVTRPQEVEHLMQRSGSDSGGNSLVWTVLRSRVQVEAVVQPSWRCSDGTMRLFIFNGIVLRPTPRAVAERGGPVMPHSRPGQGLYFWYIFPGSPADTFGLAAPGWLVQVEDDCIASIDELLEVVRSGKLRGKEWLRCTTMDSEGRPTMRALQPDFLFWPSVELTRSVAAGGPGELALPRWSRLEHSEA